VKVAPSIVKVISDSFANSKLGEAPGGRVAREV
jgi:hypothetical protein